MLTKFIAVFIEQSGGLQVVIIPSLFHPLCLIQKLFKLKMSTIALSFFLQQQQQKKSRSCAHSRPIMLGLVVRGYCSKQ